MFAAGSVKASKWGWDYKGYLTKYDASYALAGGTVGAWSPLTLAPNGLYYALPRSWFKLVNGSSQPANDVLCFKPGKSNNKTNKWEPAQIFLVPGNDPSKRPALPSTAVSTSGSLQNRFPSKGVLSHGVVNNTNNGFIYFFGWAEPYYIRLRPQLDPDADPLTTTQWDVIAYNSTSPTINAQWAGYSGGVLGQDGHIYLIPCPLLTPASARQKVIRIKPRNTSLNNTNADIIEAGYYDGTTAAKSFATGFPSAYYGVDINGNPLTLPADTTWQAGDNPAGVSLSNGIAHPNGKIYLFGGTSKRVYILDPTKWGTTSEIYTSNDLYFPNILTASPDYGWFGQGFTATLEKLRPGQDPNTLKIIFGYGGAAGSTTNQTNKVYTASIVFDPETETFTPLYDAVTNEGLTFLPISTGPAASSVTTSLMNFPNGHIFQSSQSFAATNPNERNPFGKLIYFKGDDLKYLGPQKRNIISNRENQSAYEYGATAGTSGWGSSTPGIKSSFGKTILSAVNGACEITSVKGFYPGIKYFNYDDNQNYSFISSVKTHTGITFNTSSQLKIVGLDLTSNISVGYPFILSNCVGAGSYIVEDVSLQGSDTVIDVSETNFSAGVDSDAVITYGQLVEFPDNETLRIWGVDLTNSMYNVQNINIQGSSVSGNNGVKTIYPGSQPFYDNGHTDLTFYPGPFTTSGVNPDVTASFQYDFNDSDVYDIPSNLSTLPTSLWNAYFNKPR